MHTHTPASSSIADSLVTITFLSASRLDPIAIVVVHTTSIAIGIEATNSTTHVENAINTFDRFLYAGSDTVTSSLLTMSLI